MSQEKRLSSTATRSCFWSFPLFAKSCGLSHMLATILKHFTFCSTKAVKILAETTIVNWTLSNQKPSSGASASERHEFEVPAFYQDGPPSRRFFDDHLTQAQSARCALHMGCLSVTRLCRTGILSFVHHYEAVSSDCGVNMSGGDLHRLAIARGILADAKILLSDEVTTNVDSETENHFEEGLKGFE